MTLPEWLTPFSIFEPQLQDSVLTLRPHPTGTGWQSTDINAMATLIDLLPLHPEVRVLVLRLNTPGAGELDWAHWYDLLDSASAQAHQSLQKLHRWRTLQLKVLPQAVLSVVQGHCTGVSLALLEGSDVALASDDSTFEVGVDFARMLDTAGEAAFNDTHAPCHPSPMHPLQVQHLDARQAQDKAWITLAMPADELQTKVQELTSSWLGKDALALQFTKETIAHVGQMGWDASVNYTAAKFAEIKARQAELGSSSRADAIAGFLSGQSKPGLKG